MSLPVQFPKGKSSRGLHEGAEVRHLSRGGCAVDVPEMPETTKSYHLKTTDGSHIYIYICMYVCIHIYICIYTYKNANIHIYIHVCI
jgi:hypothetical protein